MSTKNDVTRLAVPERLVILYDETCELCRRCRHWIEFQKTYLPVEFLAAGDPAIRERYGNDLPWLGQELVVLDQEGLAWIGPAAFLMCLWATVEYRSWSYTLSGPSLSSVAERFFHGISARRSKISALLSPETCTEGSCSTSQGTMPSHGVHAATYRSPQRPPPYRPGIAP